VDIMGLDHTVALDRAEELATAFAVAEPYPHVVIDDFLPEGVVDGLLAEFPDPESMDIQFRSRREIKSAAQDWASMGPMTRATLAELNASPTLDFLERLSGIAGLLVDPHLEGGGQHQISRGGKLAVHADFIHHKRLGVNRRLNLIVYLTPDWHDEWGGQLELWDADMTRPVTTIFPRRNRCIIFEVGETYFHGHPDPLACPAEVTRKSIALYYYSVAVPTAATTTRTASKLMDRPGTRDSASARADRLHELGLSLVPPLLLPVAKATKRRLDTWRGTNSGDPD